MAKLKEIAQRGRSGKKPSTVKGEALVTSEIAQEARCSPMQWKEES